MAHTASLDPALSPPRAASPHRLAWLDGLRAVAALLVVYAHLSRYLFRDVRAVTGEWLHAGTAGVMLFFLVSGYIIPASLERHGSLRSFWISRAFRLFPLYLVVAFAVCVLGENDLLPLDGYLSDHPWSAAMAHATMLPDLLGVPLVTAVFWTLSFEMAFYLIVSALFALRLHTANGVIAVILAVLAVLSAPLTPRHISATLGDLLTIGVAICLAAGLVGVMSMRRWAVLAGGVVLAGMASLLLIANQEPAHAWDGLLIVAVMFVGTTLYRADQGQTSWWRAGTVAAVVAVALLSNWFSELQSLGALSFRYQVRSVVTLLTFSGIFAVGMLTRKARTPRFLVLLGLISYSIYLVHYVLIQVLSPILTNLASRLSPVAQIPVLVAFLGVLIGISWVSYRIVEIPGQRLGRLVDRLVVDGGEIDMPPTGHVASRAWSRLGMRKATRSVGADR
ncbi:peptidoglycan/LPS O-acetylase OafA/YrhL [Krasilnikovia cinnamomea]|uniref:Peptidoglycan/LPS O-acetylase OafA/YrhL n=1 Tax=Krasilnikovia cinnamomea TaxID=349313 RepID=A0A4V2G713_9ACTN|nr:acyltransferase [Krasilnikovia cinnamomea]RZU50736.1 peptidoglycan/LPS O-acetylase OafA/YrhL [Krasilnikovia cinnamomea]